MSKKEWAYFQGKGFQLDLKQMSAEDLSYLIDLLVEEMVVRIDSTPKESEEPTND